MTEVQRSLTLEAFSPHMLRILHLAQIEASINRNGRGELISPEHILIAMLQDGDPQSLGFELINNCGLTVADLRAFNAKPRIPLAT